MSTISEEYYRRYEELRCLLERAYVDIYALQEIEHYNESVQKDGHVLPRSSFDVLGHICELLKADLGLTIWKIYFDENPKANTIKSFLSYICKNCANLVNGLHLPKTSLPKELRDTEKQLSILRKKHLAHNDAEKQHTTIKISELISITEHLRTVLNGLCFSDIDKRATVITDQRLLKIRCSVSLGLGMMIYRNTFPIEAEDESPHNSKE